MKSGHTQRSHSFARSSGGAAWPSSGTSMALVAAGAVAWMAARPQRRYVLDGRVVLITGGSRGLGLVLAREFVRQGALVALAARDADTLERARAEIAGRGARVLAVPADFRDRAQADALI